MEELWQQYLVDRDDSIREQLIIAYAPLVKKVIGRMMMTLSPALDYDDLMSYGAIGLIDAIEKFDLSRGVKFETYAVTRIRGTVYDELRALDWIPRSVRQKAKMLEKAYSELENDLGRAATDSEIAEFLGKTNEEVAVMLNEINRTTVISIDDFVYNDSENYSGLDRLEDKNAIPPLEKILESELYSKLAEAIDMLPEREKTVVTLYYYEKLTLKEIGKVLSITESRVCQLHTTAVLRLKNAISQYRLS